MLAYRGGGTAGSVFWESVGGGRGTLFFLFTAAIGTAVCPILVLISRLPDTPVDLGAWDHWGKPMLVGTSTQVKGPHWLLWNMRLSRGSRTSSWRLFTDLHECDGGTEHQDGAFIVILRIPRTTSKRSS